MYIMSREIRDNLEFMDDSIASALRTFELEKGGESATTTGLALGEIIAFCNDHGYTLSEAKFRKYVQLGLLPRSRRVANVGGKGSRGLYPTSTVRQLFRIRELMAQGHTIDAISSDFLLVEGELENLRAQLARLGDALTRACQSNRIEGPKAEALVAPVKRLSAELLRELEEVERTLHWQTRMHHAAV